MFGFGGTQQSVALTLYTDAFVIRGSIETRQRRVSDILNHADDPFLVLTDVTVDEFGSRGQVTTAAYAQVNLGSVLFAVADTAVEAVPELRTAKVPEVALISVPPFKVTGRIHLLAERDLREALNELHGTFLPVTDATYWSDSLAEARATAALVAVNHARAQILAPYRENDPWAGMSASDSAASDSAASVDAAPTSDPDVTPGTTSGW